MYATFHIIIHFTINIAKVCKVSKFQLQNHVQDNTSKSYKKVKCVNKSMDSNEIKVHLSLTPIVVINKLASSNAEGFNNHIILLENEKMPSFTTND